jgi:hypothetical protein
LRTTALEVSRYPWPEKNQQNARKANTERIGYFRTCLQDIREKYMVKEDQAMIGNDGHSEEESPSSDFRRARCLCPILGASSIFGARSSSGQIVPTFLCDRAMLC